MPFLYLLESIRFPLGDRLFGWVTYLGDETLFIVAGVFVFWCVNKLEGYYLLSVGLTGSVINQWLKLIFRIPRPWVIDENFTIVESARAAATGYSFPSGHTQNAVGTYAGAALWSRKKWVRALLILVAVLVPFSRMYLGVHTPLDIGVAALTALALVFALYPVFKKGDEKAISLVFAGMTALSLAFVLYVSLASFPAEMDAANLLSGVKNAWTLLGCSAGLWLVYEIERRYIRFETGAPFGWQVFKLVVGFGLVMAIRVGSKALLSAVFGDVAWINAVRYFLMILFAGCAWPLTFKRLPGKRQ